jgi:uncharacterized Rossmann fold enzyme
MIVVFALQAEHKVFDSILHAELMVASVRRYLPEAKIIQLSNDNFPEIPNIDEIHRRTNHGDFIEWGFGSVIDILKRGEPVLQIATDVLLNGDPSKIFDHEFDVASCKYPLKDRTDGAFCGDVNFIKPSGLKFWEDVYDYYVNTPSIRDGWEGGQTAFLKVAKTSEHKILCLPYDEYCYTPEGENEDISDAKIIHFRGNRKEFMPSYASNMNLKKPLNVEVVYNVPESYLYDNIRYSLELPLEILCDQYMIPKDDDLLIIGGAPSLKDNLGEIALRQKGGAKIWALNNTFHYLCEHGIEPDVHLMLDSRPGNIDFVPEKTDALMLYATQCHPLVFKKAVKAGKVVLWCPSVFKILEILNDKKKIAAVIQGGSTVGLKAIALSYLFGFKNIHLYGYDSSYRQGENHAYKQKLNDGENMMEITFNDKNFACAAWMATQAKEFRESLPNFIKMGLAIHVHGDGLLPYMAQTMAQ